VLIVLDADGTIRTVNRAAIQLFGYAESELTRQPFTKILDEETFVPRMHDALRSQAVLSNAETTCRSRDGRSIPLALSASPMIDSTGAMTGMVCVVRDITERKQAEEAMRQSLRQADTIRAQAEALAELSTPLIPINDRVMVMPLIGTVDSRRAQQVMETLLTGIAESHAQIAILDITGVPIVDTQVANALIRAAQAVKLLGAQVILSGIRPEVAQILVGLGVDMGGIVTRSTLQSGIAFAIRQK
jgi:rsbT co-antagonist protein RsbR